MFVQYLLTKFELKLDACLDKLNGSVREVKITCFPKKRKTAA